MPAPRSSARRAPLGGVALLLGVGAGTSVLATLTVLVRDAAPHASAGAAGAALFAVGLALGARGAARNADDVARPARRAAWLLALLAGVAAAAPRSVPWLYDLLPGSGLAAALGGALPALLSTGLLLGFLLPLLACHGVRDLERAARPGVTVLAGAFAGLALAAPLSTWITAGVAPAWTEALPAALLLLAALPAARAGRGPETEVAAPAGVPGRQGEGRGVAWPVLAASVLAGPLAVALTRLLEPVMDAGVHARDALLGAAALAAAAGLGLGWFVTRRRERPAGLTPWGLALASAAALAVLVSDEHRAERVLAIAPGDGTAWRVGWTALLAVGPPAALLAAALPPALKVRCDWTGRPGQATGRLVARTSAGLALGAVVGGWIVVPRLGAAPTVVAVAGLLLALAVVTRLRTPGRWRTAEALLFLAALGALAWPGMWQRLTEAAPRASTLWLVRGRGSAPLPVLPEPADVHVVAELLGLEETEPRLPGRLERVQGLYIPGRSQLALADGLELAGGGTTASGWERSSVEVLLGHLAFLHGSPRRALVVGYGTGDVVRALHAAGCEDIAATDGEPAWLEYASTGALGPLPPGLRTLAARSPRGALRTAGDLAGGPCDIVVLDAAPLARRGHADALSPAAFSELHEALAPGGHAVLAFDLDDLDVTALEGVIGSFEAQFPAAVVWLAEDALALTGRRFAPAPTPADRPADFVPESPSSPRVQAWRPGQLSLRAMRAAAVARSAARLHTHANDAAALAWGVSGARLARAEPTARAALQGEPAASLQAPTRYPSWVRAFADVGEEGATAPALGLDRLPPSGVPLLDPMRLLERLQEAGRAGWTDDREVDRGSAGADAEGRRAAATLSRQEARPWIETAQRAWSHGKLAEALDAARKAAEVAPGYAPAFELLAFLTGCRDADDPAVAAALAHVPDRERARRIAAWFGQTPAPLETENE
ncbi:MAG: hypothetical protein AB7T63_00990 [Planctomycetota bacterium]